MAYFSRIKKIAQLTNHIKAGLCSTEGSRRFNEVWLATLCLFSSLAIIVPAPSLAAYAFPKTSLPTVVDPTKAQTQAKLEVLKKFKGENQIKLLNNRFRVDYQVDEILLLLIRKHGAPPAILVRPDGSKLYYTDMETNEVKWHADVSYDLIRLRNPMPGPWQALGKIEDDSKIMVLSDVQLQVENLPQQVFQSERIKAQASILNAGDMIKDPAIRDVVSLRAYLYSTNEAEMPNFGASIYKLGEFYDDGRLLDERPRDGKFTVQYDFNCEVGNWTPTFRAQAELFTREVIHDPIAVLPNPISFEVKVAAPEEKYHVVTVKVNDEYLDDASLVFQGTITFPNMEVETFHFNKGQERELNVFQNEFGLFEIKADVFGSDKTGREFMLSSPAFTFITEPPEIVVPGDVASDDGNNEVESGVNSMSDGLDIGSNSAKAAEEEPEEVNVGLIITLNLLIFIVGFVLIWVLVLNKPIPNPMKYLKFKKKAKTDEPEASENKEKEDKKAPKTEGSDDILDLSLPDD